MPDDSEPVEEVFVPELGGVEDPDALDPLELFDRGEWPDLDAEGRTDARGGEDVIDDTIETVGSDGEVVGEDDLN